jgi:hypothetical protein
LRAGAALLLYSAVVRICLHLAAVARALLFTLSTVERVLLLTMFLAASMECSAGSNDHFVVVVVGGGGGGGGGVPCSMEGH